MHKTWDDHELLVIVSPISDKKWYWFHVESDSPEAGPFDTVEEAYEWVSKFCGN